MVNALGVLVGPLAGPECRRSAARGWLILVRALAAAAVFGVVAVAVWAWWLNASIDAGHLPFYEVRIGLGLVEGMLVTLALVLGPALLAGSLAGEKERGVLSLLLTTRVDTREIVCGRMAGKLAQLGMVLLAGLPALVFMASLAGVGPGGAAALGLLPAAVGLGGAGLASAASILSRRGRDALLAVYLIDLAFLLTPLSATLGMPPWVSDLISAFNPYVGIGPALAPGAPGGMLVSSGLWLAVGLIGTAVASWRLRPACLAAGDGDRPGRGRRRRFVPPVDEDRPMAWKELFIERAGTLGRFGRWAGLALVLALVLGGGGMAAVVAWDTFHGREVESSQWARDMLRAWVGQTGVWLVCLITWAVGIRAAVAVASERERGTWDALLTSPLEGREILGGKLYGSLFALRWLVLAALLAWALAAAAGAVPGRDAVRWGAEVFVVGAFMAAVGVRTSLWCATATRAMALTIGVWLGAWVAVRVAGFIVVVVGAVVLNAARLFAAQLGLVTVTAPFWLPLPGYVVWPLAFDSIYLAMTLVIVADSRLRFDRIAGRMTEGAASLAVEEFLYGRPDAPEPVEAADDASATDSGGWSEPAPAGQGRGEEGASFASDSSSETASSTIVSPVPRAR